MPIEFRHQPNAFVTGPLSWLAAYGLERAQGKQQMAQLEAQRSQELNNSIFGALSNIGTSYIDGRTQRYLSDMERQHELEDQHTAQQFALDRIAATQGPFAAEQQMVEFYQSMGLQPNHQAPSYLQAQAVVDNEIQTIKRRFDSGELTQEQFSLGMSKALKKKQSILPPFEPPPPPPESFPMFDQYGQPIMDESGQPRQFQKGGMYEMPDGRMMFMGERSGFADPKFFDPVNDDAYKPPSPADIQRIIDKADHDMSTAEATLKYHQMQAEARMNPRELAAKVGEQKAAEAEQLREKHRQQVTVELKEVFGRNEGPARRWPEKEKAEVRVLIEQMIDYTLADLAVAYQEMQQTGDETAFRVLQGDLRAHTEMLDSLSAP